MELKPLSDEQKRLVEENHKLIYWFIHKYNLSIEEYYDILALSIIKAAKTFDKSKTKFSTYASIIMRHDFLRHMRKCNKLDTVSLDSPIKNDSGEDELSYMSILSDDVDYEYIMNRAILLMDATRTLTDGQLNLLRLYLLEYKYKDIAAMLNIKEGSVRTRIALIKSKIRNYRNDMPNAKVSNTDIRNKYLAEIRSIVGLAEDISEYVTSNIEKDVVNKFGNKKR